MIRKSDAAALLADELNIEGVYKPRTQETRQTFEVMLSFVQEALGSDIVSLRSIRLTELSVSKLSIEQQVASRSFIIEQLKLSRAYVEQLWGQLKLS